MGLISLLEKLGIVAQRDRRGPAPQAVDETALLRAAREARFAPLGYLRLRLLGCLGGDTRILPQYVETPADERDLFDVYRRFVLGLVERCGGDTDPQTRSLLAAGRLAIGDLAAADDILATLRPGRYQPDHGAGYCNVIASTALSVLLPLPNEIPRPQPNYIAGSADVDALRRWLDAHRAELVWDDVQGVYARRAP